MSGLRVFWIIWCCFWAAGWMLFGFVFFPLWLGVPLSLLAILIPVGHQAPPVVAYQPPAQTYWPAPLPPASMNVVKPSHEYVAPQTRYLRCGACGTFFPEGSTCSHVR